MRQCALILSFHGFTPTLLHVFDTYRRCSAAVFAKLFPRVAISLWRIFENCGLCAFQPSVILLLFPLCELMPMLLQCRPRGTQWMCLSLFCWSPLPLDQTWSVRSFCLDLLYERQCFGTPTIPFIPNLCLSWASLGTPHTGSLIPTRSSFLRGVRDLPTVLVSMQPSPGTGGGGCP